MTKQSYKEIIQKNNFSPSHKELVKHLAVDALMFVGIYFCLRAGNIYAYVLAQALWPILFFRCFGLMHDAVHTAVSDNVKFNNFTGYILGAFCFLPYYPWKKAHLQHHYWAGNVEKDPVMKMVRDYNPEKTTKNGVVNAAWKSWVPALAFIQHTVFWGIGLKFFAEAKRTKSITSWALSYIIPAAIYFTLYKMNMFTLTNVGPALVIYLIMVEVINFPHHLDLPQFKNDTKIAAWDQYMISRSCSYPKWFARSILNNFNYHTEHHMFPQAPWYKLDSLHDQIKDVLKDKYNSSEKNAWIMKNRKKDIENVLIYKSPELPAINEQHAS